jgi:hypothetical protein
MRVQLNRSVGLVLIPIGVGEKRAGSSVRSLLATIQKNSRGGYPFENGNEKEGCQGVVASGGFSEVSLALVGVVSLALFQYAPMISGIARCFSMKTERFHARGTAWVGHKARRSDTERQKSIRKSVRVTGASGFPAPDRNRSTSARCHVALYRETAKSFFSIISQTFMVASQALNRETIAFNRETACAAA